MTKIYRLNHLKESCVGETIPDVRRVNNTGLNNIPLNVKHLGWREKIPKATHDIQTPRKLFRGEEKDHKLKL